MREKNVTDIEDISYDFTKQIQNHPFHPSHPLIFVHVPPPFEHYCNCCEKTCDEFFFRCDLCDFDLATDCAQLTPTIKYLGHPHHLLSLFNNNTYLASDYYQRCTICHKNCEGLVLRCVPCNFNLHINCLPDKIKHKNHRHFYTPTVLFSGDEDLNELYCDNCTGKINPEEPIYKCANCPFAFHIGCDSKAIAYHEENKNVVPSEMLCSRDSPLVGFDEAMVKLRMDVKEGNTPEGKIIILEREISQENQKTSPKFPTKIQHPFHSHPLTFHEDNYSNSFCSVCLIHCRQKYRCKSCNFFIDTNCLLKIPTIKYDGHEHLLIFLEKLYGDLGKCDVCNENCKTSPVLQCVRCSLNLHIDCLPSLPPTFKNPQYHLHTLTLTDSFADDLSADEFYCDFCEDERDPKLPVYYCEECPFVAHVTCVLYEVLPSIIEDEAVEGSLFVDLSNYSIEDEVEDDPTLAKIDVEIREVLLKLDELDAKERELLLKLDEINDKRLDFLADYFLTYILGANCI